MEHAPRRRKKTQGGARPLARESRPGCEPGVEGELPLPGPTFLNFESSVAVRRIDHQVQIVVLLRGPA